MSYSVLVIPVDLEKSVERVTIRSDGRDDARSELAQLQALVGGRIEAVPFPGRDDVTTYVNDEGKWTCVDEDGEVEVNVRATLLMRPGLFAGDFIAGPFVVCGFNERRGFNLDCPADLEQALIGQEATK